MLAEASQRSPPGAAQPAYLCEERQEIDIITFWPDQGKNKVDCDIVRRVEFDRAFQSGEENDGASYSVKQRVGDRNTMTGSGRAKPLTVKKTLANDLLADSRLTRNSHCNLGND
ncbi:hypothetical protein N8E89_23035 (plasmid) [Phyllobacterium sp. A18/5-2]|nr:hypothetical protein [Phyllobacterium sp. A18/5-2]UXN66094.1 hypothetical protein N8E89_23035 [Phyllobacterium sp. A18/5-2]